MSSGPRPSSAATSAMGRGLAAWAIAMSEGTGLVVIRRSRSGERSAVNDELRMQNSKRSRMFRYGGRPRDQERRFAPFAFLRAPLSGLQPKELLTRGSGLALDLFERRPPHRRDPLCHLHHEARFVPLAPMGDGSK